MSETTYKNLYQTCGSVLLTDPRNRKCANISFPWILGSWFVTLRTDFNSFSKQLSSLTWWIQVTCSKTNNEKRWSHNTHLYWILKAHQHGIGELRAELLIGIAQPQTQIPNYLFGMSIIIVKISLLLLIVLLLLSDEVCTFAEKIHCPAPFKDIKSKFSG